MNQSGKASGKTAVGVQVDASQATAQVGKPAGHVEAAGGRAKAGKDKAAAGARAVGSSVPIGRGAPKEYISVAPRKDAEPKRGSARGPGGRGSDKEATKRTWQPVQHPK